MLAAILVVAACKEPAPQYPPNSPVEISQACALTESKCTACHERERFLERRHTPDRWREIVDQMRLIPGSGITLEDAEVVLRCLNARSSATSHDTHTAPASFGAPVVAFVPRYVPRCGEVQALHYDLHNRLHSSGPDQP